MSTTQSILPETYILYLWIDGLNLGSKFDYGCIGGSRRTDCVNGFGTTKPGSDCQQISDQQQTKLQSDLRTQFFHFTIIVGFVLHSVVAIFSGTVGPNDIRVTTRPCC
jgi:hypothetical protein